MACFGLACSGSVLSRLGLSIAPCPRSSSERFHMGILWVCDGTLELAAHTTSRSERSASPKTDATRAPTLAHRHIQQLQQHTDSPPSSLFGYRIPSRRCRSQRNDNNPDQHYLCTDDMQPQWLACDWADLTGVGERCGAFRFRPVSSLASSQPGGWVVVLRLIVYFYCLLFIAMPSFVLARQSRCSLARWLSHPPSHYCALSVNLSVTRPVSQPDSRCSPKILVGGS